MFKRNYDNLTCDICKMSFPDSKQHKLYAEENNLAKYHKYGGFNMLDQIVQAGIVVLVPVIRSVAGWAVHALEDKKVTKAEGFGDFAKALCNNWTIYGRMFLREIALSLS